MEIRQAVPADEFRSLKMSWVWAGVLIVILVFGASLTPWETLEFMLAERGVGQQGATLIGFVAGYTFPLTLGIGVIAYLWLSAKWPKWSTPASVLLLAGILAGAGLVAGLLGLGLLPVFEPQVYRGGPWYALPLAYIFSSYVNSYGWSLVVCAAAVGFAAALHAERYANPNPASA